MYEYKVDFKVINESERKIHGVATTPSVDRENEIILQKAVEDALPNFMRLPVLTYLHTERPVGMVEKANFNDEGGLEITAWLKDTPDANDVWERIQKGDINAFSIYGARIEGSPQCKLSPSKRDSPCVSSKIRLDSITLCADNKVNPDASFNIVKGIIEERNIKDELLNIDKDNSSGDNIAKGEVMTETKTEPIEEPTEVLEKAEATEPVVEVTQEPAVETIEKAYLVSDEVEVIVKAQVDTIQKATEDLIAKSTDEIRKAFESEISALKEELESVKNETIIKGCATVIIEDTTKEPKVVSGNAGALNQFLKITR